MSHSILLCLPLGITSIAFCLRIPSFAKDDEKDKAKVPKIAYVGSFVMGFLAFLYLLLPTAFDFSASVDPPDIELSHLSAEFTKGDSSTGLWANSDEWTLSGVRKM